jgi:hypothetical protein
MTRRSRRELEKALDDLADDDGEDSDTGDMVFGVSAPWVEYDTDQDPGEDADVVANYQVVMRRRRAEREGREILGPVDVTDAPDDLVEIAGTDS